MIKDAINTQLDFSKTRDFTEPVTLVTLINEVLKLQEDSINKYGITIKKDISIKKDLTVEVNKSKLLNILLNLYRNAFQSIEMNKNDKKQVTTRIRQSDNKIQIDIIDNGKGIRKEDIKKNIWLRLYNKRKRPWHWTSLLCKHY